MRPPQGSSPRAAATACLGTTTTGSSLVHCKLYRVPARATLRLGSDARPHCKVFKVFQPGCLRGDRSGYAMQVLHAFARAALVKISRQGKSCGLGCVGTYFIRRATCVGPTRP